VVGESAFRELKTGTRRAKKAIATGMAGQKDGEKRESTYHQLLDGTETYAAMEDRGWEGNKRYQESVARKTIMGVPQGGEEGQPAPTCRRGTRSVRVRHGGGGTPGGTGDGAR